MKDKHAKRIERILDQFDFERCHNIMKATNWSYGFIGVPTVDYMKKVARGLLEDVVNDNARFSSTGGFTAMRGRGRLDLFFGMDSIGIDW